MGRIICKSAREIELMQEAGRIVADTLHLLAQKVQPGVSTLELDRLAFEHMRRAGAYPSFKGYRGYPASLCASINSEVVHGIPAADRRLQDGDIVSIDLGARWKGYHADAALTVPVGTVLESTRRLLRVTEEALWAGIDQARFGGKLQDIGRAIQEHVERHGYSVVRQMVGHGVGRRLHEEPQIPNYVAPDQPNPALREGMTLAIEPMVNAGGPEVEILPDNWTVVTQDGSLSAHYEHTVAITKGGPLILTPWRSMFVDRLPRLVF
ncbi:MAG: type I methionyl aminopeptidase [Armatimonadetes bacterium]|nr:type I methionyl aminopeptidase [Armatimonadota bacterium]